jgi:hypothetical protein
MEQKNDRQVIYDQTTADLLGNMQQRKSERQLPESERKKRIREKARMEKRRINQITIDIPSNLKPKLFALAEKEGIPVSQLVSALFLPNLKKLETGEISFWGFKRPSRCARYESVLDLERWIDSFE